MQAVLSPPSSETRFLLHVNIWMQLHCRNYFLSDSSFLIQCIFFSSPIGTALSPLFLLVVKAPPLSGTFVITRNRILPGDGLLRLTKDFWTRPTKEKVGKLNAGLGAYEGASDGSHIQCEPNQILFFFFFFFFCLASSIQRKNPRHLTNVILNVS